MKLYAICWKRPDDLNAGWEPAVGDGSDKPEQAFFWAEGNARGALSKHLDSLFAAWWKQNPEGTHRYEETDVRAWTEEEWSVQEYDVPAPGVEAILSALILAYYEKPENVVGGNLHIVLDDFNIRDGDIDFCLKQAEDNGDGDGVLIARLLLALSPDARRRVVG
jgi:hypothetical protein